MKRHGIFLINLGTPDSPEPKAVGRYLKEFLMDPWVIDIPYLFRWILVKLLIVPRRKYDSAKLYRKVWMPEGSPLAVYTQALETKLQARLGDSYLVVSGMRYGNPSLVSAVKKLAAAELDQITVLPLYPQYSLAATESSVQAAQVLLDELCPGTPVKFEPAFYHRPEYIDSVVSVTKPHLAEFAPDHVVFSFHGLPERQVKKTDRSGRHCLTTNDCCATINAANRDCYRAQCFETARLVAKGLGLGPAEYRVGFQSRLKGAPWIQPFTDHFYRTLPAEGFRRVAVVSPSFVADCLETLEEVQMRGQEEFRQNGGEELRLVPSLNAEEVWVSNLALWLKNLPA